VLDNRKLLQDVMPFQLSPKTIKESVEQHSGRLIVEGPIQKADTLNENRRKYPKHILEREATNYYNKYIKDHRATGELDHPESSIVNLKNVSHNIIDLW
jgi:hypothetical protein